MIKTCSKKFILFTYSVSVIIFMCQKKVEKNYLEIMKSNLIEEPVWKAYFY